MSYHDMVLSLAVGRFGQEGVASVNVHEDQDLEGDRSLDVTVILDDHAVPFDAAKAIEFKRALRAAFEEHGAPQAMVNFRSLFDEAA